MSKITLAPNASGTGTLSIASPNTDSDFTLTLPAETGTMVVTDGTTLYVDNSANEVGINTSSPGATLDTYIGTGLTTFGDFSNSVRVQGGNDVNKYVPITFGGYGSYAPACIAYLVTSGSGNTKGDLVFGTRDVTTDTRPTERMRIDSNGSFLVQMTTDSDTATGLKWNRNADASFFKTTHNTANSAIAVAYFNRQNSDGTIIGLQQADVTEGSISVSGTTVSYNGGHLSRWAQTTGLKDESLVKGTVLSNLDEMNVYTDAEGNPVDNEQLNKVKVSDVEGDPNVAGVFVNWSYDEAHSVDEINMAMTGDMIIRIAQGVTVQRGDLLMSAGDGTAKLQEDDIVRSKTVAKVTSTHVTCTYADGSYCVPCVLMAC